MDRLPSFTQSGLKIDHDAPTRQQQQQQQQHHRSSRRIMGQDSSQLTGSSQSADGVRIKQDPEEKENEQLHGVSNWDGVVGEGTSWGNTTKKPSQSRKKNRKKRKRSLSVEAIKQTEVDGVYGQGAEEDDGDTQDSQQYSGLNQINDAEATPSRASRNPRQLELEAKKLRLLAAATAAAGDANGHDSDVELNDYVSIEDDEAEQEDEIEYNKPRPFASFLRNPGTSDVLGAAKSLASSTTESLLSPEILHRNDVASNVRRSKSWKKKTLQPESTVIEVGNDLDELTNGADPESLSETQLRRIRSDSDSPFVEESQPMREEHREVTTETESLVKTRERKHKEKQKEDQLPANVSDEEIQGVPASHDTHNDISQRRQKSRMKQAPISPPKTTRSKTAVKISLKSQPIDPDLEFIDPALRDIGVEPEQQHRQIGIYHEDAISPTGRRKRRLPVNESSPEPELPSSEPQKEKRRQLSLTPKAPKAKTPKAKSLKAKTDPKKRVTVRAESPDLDAHPIPRKKGRPSNKSDGPIIKGRFTQEEIETIQQEVQKFREMTGMTLFEQNEIIQEKPARLSEMWNEICTALPHRDRVAIVKVCRRKFHNFGVRGVWTLEDDRDLKEAYKRHPNQWKQIGQILNRHHEDCRDRWRNYGVCGESMRKQAWTDEEENDLRFAVAECIQAVREDRAARSEPIPDLDLDPRSEIELVDWQVVSGKLGHTRSRLQCLDKWNRLSKMTNPESEAKDLQLGSNSWRVSSANKVVEAMQYGDYLEILWALRNSQAGREGKVPWTRLGDLDLRTKWNCMTRKVAWKKLRSFVPDNENYDFQDLVAILIDQMQTAEEATREENGQVDPQTRRLNALREWEYLAEGRSLTQTNKDMDKAEFGSRRGSHGSVEEWNEPSTRGAVRDQNIGPFLLMGEDEFDPSDIDSNRPPTSSARHTRDFSQARSLNPEDGAEDEEDGDAIDAHRYGSDDQDDTDSMDLDRPTQPTATQSSTAGRLLRSPISFQNATASVARTRATPLSDLEDADTRTDEDENEDDADMDIPARRPPVGSWRGESVDLDMG